MYYLIFLLISVFSVFESAKNICKSYYPYTFDNQVLHVWQFTAIINQLPYKEVFYPYGLLNYYKISNYFFTGIYLSIAVIIFAIIFINFNKIFKYKLFSIVSLIYFYLFIYTISGFEIFIRYGSAVGFSLLISRTIKKNTNVLILGFINGLIFSLFHDQGFYVFILAIFSFIFFEIQKANFNLTLANQSKIYYKILKYLLGMLLGLIPFIGFIFINSLFFDFINIFKELSELEQIAKIPFFHSFLKIDNIFTISIIIITIASIIFKFKISKNISLITITQINLIILILIMEQKNIIRVVDNTYTFIAFILVIYLFADILKYIKLNNKIIYYICLLTFIIFGLGLQSVEKNYTSCYLSKNKIYDVHSKDRELVINYLKSQKDFSNKVFSFPGDTIFYTLTKQKSPYYPTIFEGSSIDSQAKTIEYIKENNINYIIYNSSIISIQDEVPDVIRTPKLYKYIFNNYSPHKKIYNFIIFKKNINTNYMKINEFYKFKDLRNIFLKINLESIPKSEGEYKYLKKYFSKKLIFNNLNGFNNYLSKKNINSENTFIYIKTKNEKKTKIIVKSKNYSTIVEFKGCASKNPCLINLSNLPLFYKPRDISEIKLLNNSSLVEIGLIGTNDAKYLW